LVLFGSKIVILDIQNKYFEVTHCRTSLPLIVWVYLHSRFSSERIGRSRYPMSIIFTARQHSLLCRALY